MYKDESIKKFSESLSDKNIQMGGGSLIALNGVYANSLIQYICNLTISNKKYELNKEKAIYILNESKKVEDYMLNAIDTDSEILKNILSSWKERKNDEKKYIDSCKKAVDFGSQILDKCFYTLQLIQQISRIGNLNLVSDFEIALFYIVASIKSCVTNIKINIKGLDDKSCVEDVQSKYIEILKKTSKIEDEILKFTSSILDK